MLRRNAHNTAPGAGFSLVELLMAVAVLSIAVIPVADLLLTNSRQTRFSDNRLFAAMRARMVLDRYRALDVDELDVRFPIDGSGSAGIDTDELLSVPGSTGTSTAGSGTALEGEELERALSRDAAFPVEVRFFRATGSRAGRLEAKVTWTGANGRNPVSLLSSEWISERSAL